MSLELMTHPDFDKFDTSTLKSVGGGGAPPPKKLGGLIAEKTKGKAQGGQGYGLTETNAITVSTDPAEYKRNPSSCGRATVLVELKVVEDDGSVEGKELAAADSVGELYIRR
jgi:acyl-CoA synthetase (AMP-forming)/AMP-acid ligase II